jgi:hypothetical protein
MACRFRLLPFCLSEHGINVQKGVTSDYCCDIEAFPRLQNAHEKVSERLAAGFAGRRGS